MKTVNVSGKKCMLNLDKKGKTGTLMIPLKNHMLIGLTLFSSHLEIMALRRQLW